jgi:hypothetical protein
MNTVVAFVLGFRLQPVSSDSDRASMQQQNHLAPIGWEDLDRMFDFSNIDFLDLDEHMQQDMPENDIVPGKTHNNASSSYLCICIWYIIYALLI